MMQCKQCGAEGFELFEYCGSRYCQGCIETVTIPAEVYTRIVGYLRPIQNFNEGKKQEVRERKPFRVPDVNDLPEALPLLTTPFEVKL